MEFATEEDESVDLSLKNIAKSMGVRSSTIDAFLMSTIIMVVFISFVHFYKRGMRNGADIVRKVYAEKQSKIEE